MLPDQVEATAYSKNVYRLNFNLEHHVDRFETKLLEHHAALLALCNHLNNKTDILTTLSERTNFKFEDVLLEAAVMEFRTLAPAAA
jgi:hypothetical protein